MPWLGRAKSALDVASTIAVIVAAAAIAWTLLVTRAGHSTSQQQIDRTTGLRIEASHITNVLGTGPIAIVEFSDFQCPFCQTHAQEMFPVIKQDLVDTGRIRYIALHYPIEAIHPLALGASEAAECAANQGRFWDMQERLFTASYALTTPELMQHADALSLDTSLFSLCLTQHQTIDRIRANQAHARRLGVTGTPTFFIGTVQTDGSIDLVARMRGVVPMERLKHEIAQLTPRSRQRQPSE